MPKRVPIALTCVNRLLQLGADWARCSNRLLVPTGTFDNGNSFRSVDLAVGSVYFATVSAW